MQKTVHLLLRGGGINKCLLRWALLALFIVSCSPSSMEEYQYEGEGLIQELISDLEKIESAQELKGASARLKKKFSQLADLMVAAEKYQARHPKEESSLEPNLDLSNSLKAEFVRIYRIEGCREIMEEVQQESLHRIGALHKSSE